MNAFGVRAVSHTPQSEYDLSNMLVGAMIVMLA